MHARYDEVAPCSPVEMLVELVRRIDAALLAASQLE